MRLAFLAVAAANVAGAVVVNGEVLGQGKTVAVPALFGVLLGHHFGLVGNLVQVGDQLGNAECGGAARHAGDPSCSICGRDDGPCAHGLQNRLRCGSHQ